MSLFSLEVIGGPWSRRLATRHAGLELDWSGIAAEASEPLVAAAREVWTRSAFSEYASGACFAEIASALTAAKAPIDLIAAAGEFVADEMFHAELSSRVAMALGGAVPLEADLTKLVRPAVSTSPLMRAAELVVRTCCVGEALTVPMLNQSRRAAGSKTIEAVITRILRDESQHAQLGWWFLDWAELSDAERAVLGVGDVNGDGFDDVLFAPSQCSGHLTYVLRGSSTGVAIANPLNTWTPPAQCLGNSVAR